MFEGFHSSKHVRTLIDSTRVLAVINHMGSVHSDSCHLMAKEIWEFCISYSIRLTAAHLPGSSNVDADYVSRNFTSVDTNWMLNTPVLTKALPTLFLLNYLFASRLNKQFGKYYVFHPDPDAVATDVFSLS